MLRAVLVLLLLAPAPPAPAPTVPAELTDVFATPAEMRLQGIATTAEGLFVEQDGVVFSDTNFWREIRVTPDGAVAARRVEVVANGRARDKHGSLWQASRLKQRLTRFTGDTETLLEQMPKPATNGGTIADTVGGPTRLVIAADDRFFWTDPAHYLEQSHPAPRPGASYAFRWQPGADRFDLPVARAGIPRGVLGLALSPDERLLYLSDFDEGRVLVASADDFAAPPRELAGLSETGDRALRALATDVAGRIYCAGSRGVVVLSAAGKRIGTLALPEPATDLAWGGPDRRTLWITTFTGLYRATTRAAGGSPR